jgi:purine-binding chemotaxis protein CheW
MKEQVSITHDEVSQYLKFDLGAEEFALDIRSVREIIQFGALTSVPLMPPFVRGVINLRGAVVPVIDLQFRLGLDRSVLGKKTCIVIFEGATDAKDRTLGLMVDAVSEVVDIGAANIEPAPEFGAVVHRHFIQGIGKIGVDFIVILNPARAMDVDDMAVQAEQPEQTQH